MTARTARNEPGSGGTGGRASEASSEQLRAQREQREPGEARDAVRVLRGNPAAEEIAALVAVLSAVGGGEEAGLPRARSAWSDPAWRLVGPQARRGGWRGSSLPR
ncbi:hypothetical protein Intca_1243 [Intrasporangium calvum DSM 43043]|uniref:Acyl-CoA carboxylase epsilon subunit n=1 Tax=Intrasporangium calvum (strain ATCC 23552 / DSM 43043 / JCM 3097 / NBRC 12989 / NCIMB 10167 / NRRL B-3866 / 7 KIP) TaxID=710696 RepID=E6SFL6_INTC7|nr:hypothetical protein Intca_1243 [Intrasporangium calvum DSM 43043]